MIEVASKDFPEQLMRNTIDTIYRTESRRVSATLARLLGDFELAEEAMHDAFAVALDDGHLRPTPTGTGLSACTTCCWSECRRRSLS